jgi:tetratricopeptide (TPR) repeat protein
MAHSQLESYGAAVGDAELAIELDPLYVKAYYRRAAGNFALQKYKLSVRDFKHVCRLAPKDKAARVRLAEADKAAKAKAFADAIESEQTAPFGEERESSSYAHALSRVRARVLSLFLHLLLFRSRQSWCRCPPFFFVILVSSFGPRIFWHHPIPPHGQRSTRR